MSKDERVRLACLVVALWYSREKKGVGVCGPSGFVIWTVQQYAMSIGQWATVPWRAQAFLNVHAELAGDDKRCVRSGVSL